LFHENGNFWRAEVGKKVKKNNSKSPLLNIGGVAKQGIKKYSPEDRKKWPYVL
jgi:hypothetical protein